MQKHVNLVDFFERFSTTTFLPNLASIQPRKSLYKFVQFSHSCSAYRFDFHIGTTPHRGARRARSRSVGRLVGPPTEAPCLCSFVLRTNVFIRKMNVHSFCDVFCMSLCSYVLPFFAYRIAYFPGRWKNGPVVVLESVAVVPAFAQ